MIEDEFPWPAFPLGTAGSPYSETDMLDGVCKILIGGQQGQFFFFDWRATRAIFFFFLFGGKRFKNFLWLKRYFYCYFLFVILFYLVLGKRLSPTNRISFCINFVLIVYCRIGYLYSRELFLISLFMDTTSNYVWRT